MLLGHAGLRIRSALISRAAMNVKTRVRSACSDREQVAHQPHVLLERLGILIGASTVVTCPVL
jgi:hypothetical protein